MSKLTGDAGAASSLAAWKFCHFHASAALRQAHNAPHLRLFKILQKAGENLDSELCPDQPKSIYEKGCDVRWGLGVWREEFQNALLAQNGSPGLQKELEICQEVLDAAHDTIHRLQSLVVDDIRTHPEALDRLQALKLKLREAMQYINDFTSSARPQPACNESALHSA